MTQHELVQSLQKKTDSKIVMLVGDGLGGLPHGPGGQTELEAATTPNLDQLASRSSLGLSTPVLPGITPGSGPGHLGLFGYDPLEFQIGRGVLEALGIDFDLGPDDVAIRGNFCTLDDAGNISDRRAGRVGNDVAKPLCEKLDQIQIPGVEVFVRHVKEYRLVVVFRAAGLGGDIHDTDPQKTGVAPLEPAAKANAAAGTDKTIGIAQEFLKQAREVLKDDAPANFLTLRGIAKRPAIPTFEELYGTRAGAVAVYPMYRGLARLVGMDVLDAGQTLEDQMARLKADWDNYDFFFVHFKYTDSTGEDGNFDAKVERTEQLDGCIPAIEALGPDVLIVTGDHSTPSKMKSHSWHGVPTLLATPESGPTRFEGGQAGFGETACRAGALGHFEAKHLMLLAMAHAGKLEKFGA